MATLVRIPPEHSIYDAIMVALNENRIWDVIQIASQLTLEQHNYFKMTYPEIYATYCVKINRYMSTLR